MRQALLKLNNIGKEKVQMTFGKFSYDQYFSAYLLTKFLWSLNYIENK